MRIDEVTSPLKSFLASVRVGGFSMKTLIDAESLTQARQLLVHLYGPANVLSVMQVQSVTNEAESNAPKSPEQLRVKALSDQAANLKQQAKRMSAQQGLAKAQERLRKATAPKALD